jgi:hypothetical protein
VSDIAPAKPGRFVDRFTTGNLIELGVICGMGLIAWATLTSDFRALAQRVDQGDKRDEKTADVLDVLKGSVIRIETEQKAVRSETDRQGRQLDRIEQLLRSGTTPMPPPRTTP